MQKNITTPKKPRWLTRLCIKLILLLLGLCIAGAGTLVLMISIIYPKLPSMDELRNYQPKLPLQVYSKDNVLLGQFGQEHRIYVSYKETPQMLVNAILAAEDERFFQHGGIDYISIIRATLSNVISGHIQSGASTITMQVARNFFLSSQRTFSRKFNEILLSYKIEKSLTKDQILELYINQIYLGQRSYGFAEAAITYFGKPLDRLSIAEYAVLAGLPKAPSAFNPVVNKKRSHDRELYVLDRMRILHLISKEQYEVAVNQKIVVVKGSNRDATDSGGYIAEMVRGMLYDKYGDSIYTKGYKVYTTIDSKMQQAAYIALRNGLLQYDNSRGYNGAERQLNLDRDLNDPINQQVLLSSFDNLTDSGDLQAAIVISSNANEVTVKLRNENTITISGKQLDWVRKYLTSGGDKEIKRGAVIRVRNVDNKWTISQIPTVQGALVALNPNDGGIDALVGGFDYTSSSFNHVTQAMRQPGSSFKPFIYSAAINKGLNANTVIGDSEICFPSGGADGGQWCPQNDEQDFNGPVTLRQALARSLNVVTVKILDQVSPQYAIDYITRFGFNKDQFQPYLTMALGANEVTPLQMAQAYAVFANGGYLIQPYLITSITDNKGTVIAKTDPVDIHKEQPVIDPRNAYIMNSIMQDVVRYGTGARAYRDLKRNDIAGKTGTTTDAKDVWFDGYTPNLVAVTWVGFDQPKSLGTHAFGATIALPIWIDFMRQALANMPQVQLAMPGGIETLHNTTWKGNDEYVYNSSESASVTATNSQLESNSSAQVTETESTSGNTTTPLQESNNQVVAKTTSNQVIPAPIAHRIESSSNTVIESDIDDVIKNVQD